MKSKWELWLSVICPHCQSKNWFFHDSSDYNGEYEPPEVSQCYNCSKKWMEDIDDPTYKEFFFDIGPNNTYKTTEEFVHKYQFPNKGEKEPK